MRVLAFLLGSLAVATASADMVGQWQGIVALGPSNIAQGMDGDKLLKLQISKAFMKTLVYQLQFNADKTFASKVTGTDMKPRRGRGKYEVSGNLVTLSFTEQDRAVKSQILKGTLTPDGKKLLISMESKPGFPATKFVFKKVDPAAPKSAKSTRH